MKSRDPSRPSERAAAVGDVLRTVLQRVDPEQQLRAYSIWSFWNDTVGSGIARRAQPARFRNGILFVTVATHSWLQELQFMKDGIRDRLNARLGANLVRDIFFVSGSVDVEPPAAAPSPPRESAPLAVADAGGAVVPPLADAELAAVFARVIAARAKRMAARAREKSPRRTRQRR